MQGIVETGSTGVNSLQSNPSDFTIRTMNNATQKNTCIGADESRPSLLDMSLNEMAGFLHGLGEPAYRARQIFKWMYRKGVFDPAEMTDFSKPLRSRLHEMSIIALNKPEEAATSRDGTRKFLFRLTDGAAVESVLIPSGDHATLCVSTQAGCAMGCAFCLTGAGGLKRNLTSGEILNQLLYARSVEDPVVPLTNVVFMGMGEPLANYDQTIKALRIMVEEGGIQFGKRRITLSTVGLAPMIRKLGRDLDVNLAVSLNAPDDDIRSRLMPVNRTYPIHELLDACRDFPLTKGRRITFEYILIDGVNDQPAHAEKLAKLLRAVQAKINLIPYNEHPGSSFRSPTPEAVERFQRVLTDRHYTAIIRKSMGRDILAACGQLAADRQKA